MITIATATVTAQTASKPYDGNTSSSVVPVVTGLIAPDFASTAPTQTYDNSNVGTGKTMTATGLVINDGNGGLNYTINYVTNTTGVITTVPLTVTAENKSKEFDGLVFPGPYTVAYVGFVNGETSSVLNGALGFSGTAISATAVGTGYVIHPSGLTSGNYDITFLDGTLTIYAASRQLTVLLQGPYDEGTGLMKTDLYAAGKVPLSQPYGNVAPWYYTGTESVGSMPANVVDWVLVELRTTTTTTFEKKAGLLYKDGSVTVGFNTIVPDAEYYIIVWHRNHMPVMSEEKVKVHNATTPYDFTLLANCYSSGAVKVKTGTPDIYAMIAGDVTKNGLLQYSGPGNDRGAIISAITAAPGGTGTGLYKTVTGGYWFEDANLNNQLSYLGDDNDRAKIIANLYTLTGNSQLNITYTSIVPGYYTGGKDGSNDGPVDIQMVESAQSVSIELMTNELIGNGMADNIQFTLAWKAGDAEIEQMLANYTSVFMLEPQGSPVEIDGMKYLTYVSVTPTYLPPMEYRRNLYGHYV